MHSVKSWSDNKEYSHIVRNFRDEKNTNLNKYTCSFNTGTDLQILVSPSENDLSDKIQGRSFLWSNFQMDK